MPLQCTEQAMELCKDISLNQPRGLSCPDYISVINLQICSPVHRELLLQILIVEKQEQGPEEVAARPREKQKNTLLIMVTF